ncbi:hypothetical protein [Mycoplasma sp. 5370]
MKNKLVYLNTVLVSTIPFSFVSCVKIFDSENEEIKEEKQYRMQDIYEFGNLLSQYQENNNIKKIEDPHFMINLEKYKHFNYQKKTYEKQAYQIIKNGYKIIYSFNELQESFLNFFNKSFWENLYNQNPELDKNNYHSLSEEEIQEINKKEFEKHYLNGVSSKKFFENNNLILSQPWYWGMSSGIYYSYLIPFFENQTNQLILKKVQAMDLPIKTIDLANSPYFKSILEILKIDKNKKVEIIDTPIDQKEAERLFEFLKKKYDVNNGEKENS